MRISDWSSDVCSSDLPLHPYTEGLMRSIPHIDEDVDRLQTIEGLVPSPGEWPEGCRFHPRCPHAGPSCTRGIPPLAEFAPNHRAACIRYRADHRAASPAAEGRR